MVQIVHTVLQDAGLQPGFLGACAPEYAEILASHSMDIPLQATSFLRDPRKANRTSYHEKDLHFLNSDGGVDTIEAVH